MKLKMCVLIGMIFFFSCKEKVTENIQKNNSGIAARFVLPYPVGKAYTCSLGFDNVYSHNGSFKYSVDFDMPIGTVVTAALAGRVDYTLSNYSDYDRTPGHENVVVIRHDDTTYSRYAHLTAKGILVRVGQVLAAGDTIGLSGNSGSGGAPHLHFDVTKTNSGRGDQTVPFDFKNIKPHPFGFTIGDIYEALPY